jgi:glycosyltransferase involved in cell wall biosynthesis
LRELPSVAGDDEVFLYSDKPFDFGFAGRKWTRIVIPVRGGLAGMFLWHIRAVLHAKYSARVDRFIAVATLQAAVLAGPVVLLVVPDLTHVLHPQWHAGKAPILGRLLMRAALRRAWRVVAISEHTRKDILLYAGRLSPDKVRVAHIGCGEMFRRKVEPGQIAEVLRRHGLTRRYLLFVGTLEPRKNISGLIRAFSRVASRISGHELVIAGRKGWKWEPIEEAAESSPVRARIRFLDYVPAEDLPALYQGADAMVYPSLYEGFGIPVLEAMSCGVPVVTSNVSAIPEVTADAALLVDPADEKELAEKILVAVEHQAVRAELIRKGRERAELFSWRRFASEIVSILHGEP